MLDKIASSLHTTIDELIEGDISRPALTSKPSLNQEWLYLIERAIRDGMTKEEFIEFQYYLKFRKTH